MTQRSVGPLTHAEQLIDSEETRGARFLSTLDLESAYMQFRIREEDQFRTSFRMPGGQYEFWVGAFGAWHGINPYAVHALYFRPPRPVLRCRRPGSARHLPA